MTAVWASHREERCSDGVVAPHVCAHMVSRTLKVRGGIISQANRYLRGFCSSQRIFPPQIIQVLLITNGVSIFKTNSMRWLSCNGHALPPRWSGV